MRLAIGVLFIIFSSFGYTEDSNWRWVYVSSGVSSNTAFNDDVFYRSGNADVKITGRELLINFHENNMPEMAAYFKGKVAGKLIEGNLSDFFPSETTKLKYSGTYSVTKWGINCNEHEIILLPVVRNASVFIFTHLAGDCKVVKE